jgi:alcohol dehydrogenase (cytochrome c)
LAAALPRAARGTVCVMERGGAMKFVLKSTTWLVPVALAVAAPCAGQSSARVARAAFSVKRLVEPPTVSWPTNGGNLYNQRYSPLDQINAGNVAGLKGVWRARLEGSGVAPQFSAEAQPVVHDGVAYLSTGANDVFALSLETGAILWQYEAHLDPAITSVCCGWNNRGVALSADKVFVGRLDGRLVALERKTGKPVWTVEAERWQDNFSITPAPVYVDGLVITGFAGADRGTRGRVKAYDAEDGGLVWTFYTIPGPGEPGHETWPQDNDAWRYGGASVWQTPAVDPELGLVYFSTGNAGPDYNGAVRAGDNLYSASIVAVELKTGRYRWHFQQVHHDIWDYDSSNPVVLMDLMVGGAPRKALVEVSKTGWAYILDRETGEPIVGIDERPVPQERTQATAATQPFPRGEAVVPQSIEIPPEGFDLVNSGRIFTPFVGEDPTIVKPGIWGGANWPPSAYDPRSQRLFVCASSAPNGFTGGGDDDPPPPVQGESYTAGRTVFSRMPRTGIVAAMDMTTNTAAWRYRWPEQCYSGLLATGGDLLFVGRNDGRLTALDSRTGKQLWEFQTGAGMHAPVSTFEYAGKQYVLAYSGGNALIGSARGDSVWLFGLDGALAPAEAGVPVSRLAATMPVAPAAAQAPGAGPAPPPADLSRAAADLASGRELFGRTCAVCHGDDGMGGHGGGAPLNKVAGFDFVVRTVSEGRNYMPEFSTLYSPEQIRDIAAYVLQRFASPPERAE